MSRSKRKRCLCYPAKPTPVEGFVLWPERKRVIYCLRCNTDLFFKHDVNARADQDRETGKK
ncbi:MAG: hypothetical protein KatS3mg082_1754 [Nitrospiraceae bacterium]|nr:MAG: hypothetical protein KatS3mg082_1754 [Nitrospiraceae bacterium]